MNDFIAQHQDGIATRLAQIAEYRSEAQKAREGDRKTAGFYHYLANMAQEKHDRITPALDYVAQHGVGATLTNKAGKQFATLFPDASVPGSYRYQLYDARGFFSHSTHATLYAAALDAAEQGYYVPDHDAPARIMTLRSFERGNRLAAVIMDVNANRITWQQGNAMADAISAEYPELAEAQRATA